MNAPFFLKRQYIERVSGENLFFPWRSPLRTYDPYMRANPGNIRSFGPRGFLEEMVERQGKGDQNVWNEPNDAPLSPWVHNMAC